VDAVYTLLGRNDALEMHGDALEMHGRAVCPSKPDSGHADAISIAVRVLRPSQNAMKFRIQRVPTR
jgi:hypothetical protein